MPNKDHEKQLENQRRHYRQNKSRYLFNLREKRRQYKEDYVKYMEDKSCIVCGEDHIACLDFHHRNPEEKEYVVSKKQGTVPMKYLLKEIEKCDILCANCHRKLHAEENGFYLDSVTQKINSMRKAIFGI